MMASPGRSEKRTCHLRLLRRPAAQAGLGRGSPRVFVGSAVGKPRSSVPSLAPGPGSGGTSPAALPLRPLPVSLSLSAAGPRPVRAARGPIVPRRPGRPLRESEGCGGRCSLRGRRLAERVWHEGGTRCLAPLRIPGGVLSQPQRASWGSRSRKVRTEIPSNLFKGLAAARNFFFPLFRLHPVRLPSVVSFLSLYRIRLPHCMCICEFAVEQLCLYSAVFVSVSRGGCRRTAGGVGVRDRRGLVFLVA